MNRENLEKMLERGSDNALLRYTLGSLYLKEKDSDMAVRHLAEAVKQDPNHSASWKLYGKALAASDREDEARQAYRKGIAVAEARGDVQAAKEMGVFLKRLE
ncbi:MAG: tetratricopeptide repeat protein [Candidatus Thiodiazotropha sp.]